MQNHSIWWENRIYDSHSQINQDDVLLLDILYEIINYVRISEMFVYLFNMYLLLNMYV